MFWALWIHGLGILGITLHHSGHHLTLSVVIIILKLKKFNRTYFLMNSDNIHVITFTHDSYDGLAVM